MLYHGVVVELYERPSLEVILVGIEGNFLIGNLPLWRHSSSHGGHVLSRKSLHGILPSVRRERVVII
jgi:hypothetical protein